MTRPIAGIEARSCGDRTDEVVDNGEIALLTSNSDYTLIERAPYRMRLLSFAHQHGTEDEGMFIGIEIGDVLAADSGHPSNVTIWFARQTMGFHRSAIVEPGQRVRLLTFECVHFEEGGVASGDVVVPGGPGGETRPPVDATPIVPTPQPTPPPDPTPTPQPTPTPEPTPPGCTVERFRWTLRCQRRD